MIQFSNSSAHTTLREELLDGTKTYQFGITSLSVPLQDCPMHPVTEEQILFTIRRRNIGTAFEFSAHARYPEFAAYQILIFTDAVEVLFQLHHATFDVISGLNPAANTKAAIIAVYTPAYQGIFNPGTSAPLFEPDIFTTGIEWTFSIHPSRPHFSVNDFMQTVSNFTNDFNEKLTLMGLAANHFGLANNRAVAAVANLNQGNVIEYMSVRQQPDTSALFFGTRDFWDGFYFEFSLYGLQLFGIDKTKMLAVDGRYYLGFAANVLMTAKANLLDGNDQFIASNNTFDQSANTKLPLFECCDQRVYVSVSCHLPMDSHIVITNGVQTASRDIATAFFDNQAESIVQYNENGYMSLRIKGRTYSSQTHMIKKSDYIKWHKLNESYRLRFLRFYLHICYKLYNATTDTFVLTTQDFPIKQNSYWQMFVRFVSNY